MAIKRLSTRKQSNKPSISDFPEVQVLINDVLNQQGRYEDTVKIDSCARGQLDSKGYCQSHFCIRCWHYKTGKQRKHLGRKLPAILALHPKAQLWHITACAADCEYQQINEYARAAVTGTKRLLKHPDIKGRVLHSFSIVEVAHKFSKEKPCCHTHTLLVCRPITHGRYRIGPAKWVRLWEELCSLPRQRPDPSKPLGQRLNKEDRKNVSILVQRVGQTQEDLKRTTKYVTKWANSGRIIRNFKQRLVYPLAFITGTDQLRGVHRFWGSMRHRANKAKLTPATPTSASLGNEI